MIGRPGVAAQMFSTLAAAGINIQMISTSEVKVSCTVETTDCDRAIAALCSAFQITSSPVKPEGANITVLPDTLPPVRGAALDRNQARLAISPSARSARHGGSDLSIFGRCWGQR